jgi:hypothetical protein
MQLRTGFWPITLGFALYWVLAVIGREHVDMLLTIGALLAPLLPAARQRKWLLMAAPLGIVMDAAWHYCGVMRFIDQPALPVWLIALWVTFSGWWYWLLPQLKTAVLPLALVGAIVDPVTYLIGWQLQAITPEATPQIMLLIISMGWAVYLPLISFPVLRQS